MAFETSEHRPYYAHTRENQGPEHWRTLSEHLRRVGELAAEFAAAFGSAEWGRLAGFLHDVGKYAEDFQNKLHASWRDPDVLDASVLDGASRRVDHSTAGAVRLLEIWEARKIRGEMPVELLALAMLIAGHHAGLPAKQTDAGSFIDGRLTPSEKRERLKAARRHGAPEIDAWLDFKEPPRPPLFARPAAVPKIQRSPARMDAARKAELLRRFEFWTRMLFSCLIDADRLDAEAFGEPERAEERERTRAGGATLGLLLDRLNRHLDNVAANAEARVAGLPSEARAGARAVLKMRADVLADCRKAAEAPPGRFSLTVPTGGGKTLASLAFALEHAIRHGLRRVIVVIPFTSIIDQTARAYREAFGDLAHLVIEHHSNLDPTRETVHNRLASENWDAPVIVTTSAQFFESLHADRGTAARKLHNIARSAVVLDEVQTLPPGLRSPIFEALNSLVDDYGVSLLCCTATQPALDMDVANLQEFPHLANVREVVADSARLFRDVRSRVTADFSQATAPVSWETIADQLKTDANRRSLAIVERRDDARALWELLRATGARHLSALMCGEHRRKVLAEIAETLNDPTLACRVVATTLVEAGVDLDFPAVHRVLGGIDALAQAAGRCNRAGALADADGRPVPGRLTVFLPATESPPGLRLGRQTTSTLIAERRGDVDLFDPETYEDYFKLYLDNINPDAHDVMPCRENRDFPETARRFRMIDDQDRRAVVVPHGDAPGRVQRYRDHPDRDSLRALQPFLVEIPPGRFKQLANAGAIETIHEQVHWIANPNQYDADLGLIIDEARPLPPEDLVLA